MNRANPINIEIAAERRRQEGDDREARRREVAELDAAERHLEAVQDQVTSDWGPGYMTPSLAAAQERVRRARVPFGGLAA